MTECIQNVAVKINANIVIYTLHYSLIIYDNNSLICLSANVVYLTLDVDDKDNSTNLNRMTKIDLKIFNHVNNLHNLSRQ